MKEINGNALFNLIAGHSDYHGNDILVAIRIMQEGKEPKEIKPIDIASAVPGHWVKNDVLSDDWNTTSNCSVCGGCVSWFSIPLNYCPHCGAKMDEN